MPKRKSKRSWHKEPNMYRYFGNKEYRLLGGTRSTKTDAEQAVRNLRKNGKFPAHGNKKKPVNVRNVRHPEGVGYGWVTYYRFKNESNDISGTGRRKKRK